MMIIRMRAGERGEAEVISDEHITEREFHLGLAGLLLHHHDDQ